MKNVKPIIMPRDKARKKWKEYIEASRIYGDKYLKELKGVYYHLSKERKIIDIFEAFKFAGLNEKDEPKLAIAKADSKWITFVKQDKKRGYFSEYRNKDSVYLPENTFNKEFPLEAGSWVFSNERIRTKVPIIPANKLPKKGKLKDFYILWEVNSWETLPRDPFLLKRISNNLFVIMSSWNLTKLEQSIMRGG
jgi:hypothetical protein